MFILKKQVEEIEVVKEEGKYKGRKSIDYPKNWDKYYKMMKNREMKGVEVMKLLDLKKTTFYKLVKQYEE